MRLKLSTRARYSLYCLTGVALAVGLIGLGAILGPHAPVAEASVQPEQTVQAEEPAPVSVPNSAAGARSSGPRGGSGGGGGGGGSGGTWMSGDPAQLSTDFKRSVARQFGNGTMGQAHMAMSGLGFQCAMRGGRMDCEKSLQADNCTLTWSVSLKSRGVNVSGAGGEGFNRECN